MKKILLIILFTTIFFSIYAQVGITSSQEIDYTSPKEYEIAGITISGVQYLDQNVLLFLTGLSVGDKITIPGDKISKCIKKLWEQNLFSDISISVTKVIQDKVFLDIYLKERPRLAKYNFSGVKKKEAEDITEKIHLTKGIQVNEDLIQKTKEKVNEYFIEKGFRNVNTQIEITPDNTLENTVLLTINVKKNSKIKIHKIIVNGNETKIPNKKFLRIFKKEKDAMSDNKVRWQMKETKQKQRVNIFKASKLIPEEFEKDKQAVIDKYNELGFRDAKIISDSIVKYDDKSIDLILNIEEGKRFYFGNISFLGNTKYTTEQLHRALGLKKGDLFNKKQFEEKLYYDPAGVMSLYQDEGYLFSNVAPVETNVNNDSIDVEIRIYEGKQATINKVSIVGNTRTNDFVVLREIRTKPGNLYRRAEVQRTVRELAQLGYFDPEKLNVDFNPDPVSGTVDLEYQLEEKPSDQIELSGGYGAGVLIGSIGLTFNNFSLRNIFNGKSYRPLPSGDGQKLSLRAQAGGYGYSYRTFSFSFIEPWFGRKRPNSLALSAFHSVESNNAKEDASKIYFKVSGAALGLGQRLRKPDDYFSLYNEISYKHYNVKNHSYFMYKTGVSNNISYKVQLSRESSGPNPIYPTVGSSLVASVELTPPYSSLNGKDYSDPNMTTNERYKWIEYHKYRLTGRWYTTIFGSKDGSSRALVLMTKFDFGLLGLYNRKVGMSPFEGFQMGGDGMYNMGIYGIETISMRGYEHNALTPNETGTIFNKYTIELRYPLTLNPSATFFVVAFAEAGNAWTSIKDYHPLDVKRAAGVGLRVYMPMIGLLGIDWGYGFDAAEGANKSQVQFVLGQQF